MICVPILIAGAVLSWAQRAGSGYSGHRRRWGGSWGGYGNSSGGGSRRRG